jgi:hypothetical protein
MPESARTLFHLRVGDVIVDGARDWLVEGVLVIEGGQRPMRLVRLWDRATDRWLATDGVELILLPGSTTDRPGLPPPDPLVLGTERLLLAGRGGGVVVRSGDCGMRSAERCRYWLYKGAGPLCAWIDDFPGTGLLYGEVVPPNHSIELLPGS